MLLGRNPFKVNLDWFSCCGRQTLLMCTWKNLKSSSDFYYYVYHVLRMSLSHHLELLYSMKPCNCINPFEENFVICDSGLYTINKIDLIWLYSVSNCKTTHAQRIKKKKIYGNRQKKTITNSMKRGLNSCLHVKTLLAFFKWVGGKLKSCAHLVLQNPGIILQFLGLVRETWTLCNCYRKILVMRVFLQGLH